MPAEEHIRYVPEPASVDVRVVLAGAIGALLLLGLAIGVLYGIYQVSVPIKTVQMPAPFAHPRVVPSQDEIAERKRLANSQNQRLETWQWANSDHTLVHIPIERAMKLLSQKGSDAWAPELQSQAALSSPAASAENAMTAPGAAPPGGQQGEKPQ